MRETRSLSAPLASAAMAAALAALAALAAGCGGGTSNAGASPTDSTTSASAGPSSSRPPLTTGNTASLTGTAVRGAEPGCVGLKSSDGHSYELTGDAPRQLARGGGSYQAKLGKVKVTGHFASAGMASHCMMGRIFVVSKLEKVG